MTVHFGFTSDQVQLRDGLRDTLTGACPPPVVRAAWQRRPDPVPGIWKHLGEIGLLGLMAPVDVGGTGCSEVEMVLLLEECGRFAVPGPLGEHVAVAVPALAAAGAPEVGKAISGDAVVTAQDAGSARVRWIGQADLLVRLAGDQLELVSAEDIVLGDEQPSVDLSVPSAMITARHSQVLPHADLALARRRGTLAAAAQLLGLADQMIAMATGHVRTRTQFGIPVGAQQAVKHLLANALVALEHARPVVYRAGWVLAADPAGIDPGEPDLAVSFAKIYASRAADLAARTALQCHGAIGYSWEHDLHLWMKRAWALGSGWGTTAEHEQRVAAALLDSNGLPSAASKPADRGIWL
jgi:alkylation response protein AidB-like acyl-CoA dehydrogenase